jgi:acetyl-CoA synthetase
MLAKQAQPGLGVLVTSHERCDAHSVDPMRTSYEQVCAAHRWEVPAQYNIASDVCDKHPREKLAMVWESFDGSYRELLWGELQDLANQAAHVLRAHGVERGDRVAVVLPATPETAAIFFGVWKLGAILLSMSVLYGDDSIRHRLSDSGAKLVVTDAANAKRFDDFSMQLLVLDEDTLAGASTEFVTCDTSAGDPAQLYYTSGTTGLAKGIVHAHRYILAHEEFVYCHEVEDGERFHGMGEWAWAAGVAPLLGPWRLGAVQCVYRREAGFDPHLQLDFLSHHHVTNVFTTPTAMRAMMAIADAGRRYPQKFRRVCSAGEPLNPEAIRWFREQYGVTVLDYYGLTESYPLVANYPFMEVREGSMGKPMPGWEVEILDEDEHPVARGERGEICLRARSNPHFPLGYWNRPAESDEVFGGEWFHTKDSARQDDDGYVWYEGRADDVIIAAGYRIGPFEVESACLEHPAVREAAAIASPDELRGNVVKAFIVLAPDYEPSDELAEEIKTFVRNRLSAYAYPRRIEFVADLPKTLTGKIRRIVLRQLELERAQGVRG